MFTGVRKFFGLKGANEEIEDSPPYYDEYDDSDKENYVIALEDENDLIQGKFNQFVTSTFDSLIERDINVSSLIIFFQQRVDVATKLERVETIHHVHAVVKAHFSFLNFEVIEDLVNAYGTEKDKKNLKEYVEAFDKFIIVTDKNRVKLRVPHIHGKNKIVLKLDLDSDKIPLKTLRMIKKRISSILKVNRSVLELKEIVKGCLELEFLVPAVIWERVFKLRGDAKVKNLMFKMSITCIEVYTSEKVSLK